MTRFWSIVLCPLAVALLASPLMAQDNEKKETKPAAKAGEKKEAGDKKEDEEKGEKKEVEAISQDVLDKVSYLLGMNQGKEFKASSIDINPELLAQGLGDGLKGTKPKFTDEELKAAIETLREQLPAIQAKRKKVVADANLKVGKDFLEKNAKREGVTTTKSGLQYEVIKKGDGKTPKKTDTVVTHYHGTLVDGTVFDSSVQRKQPATFGVGDVIKGWTEALQLMKVGDKWKIYVPAELAYGENPRPGGPIGPNAALVFEIELLEIEKAE